MALYAFDGTWNTDRPGTSRDTNVAWFHRAYASEAKHYYQGVGTRFGGVGQVVGGITGAGGRQRIEEAIDQLRANFDNGDRTIDIVGFSRGAALAVHFANQVATKEVLPGPQGSTRPPVRFLGIWDCVPSFGIASIPVNIGWDLDFPGTVQKCFHALSLDERRNTFKLHRLNAQVEDADGPGVLYELWFRGVHSDVGGGNENPGLSSIALNWMFNRAASCGLPLDAAVVAENAARMTPAAPISRGPKYDLIRFRRRSVRYDDQVHRSVSFCVDADGRQHNNPPKNVEIWDDDCVGCGRFTWPT